MVLFFLLLLLLSPAWAQTANVTFVSDPPGARVFNQYDDFLGVTGQPVQLDLAKYGTTMELTLRHEGYEPLQLSLKPIELQGAGRYPKAGALRLDRTPTWSEGLSSKLALAASCVVLGGSLAVISFRQRFKVQERKRREQILSEVDLSDSMASRKLGPYRLLQKLGRGGMATVYRAVLDATMNEAEAVAVKVLKRDIFGQGEFLERFRREALLTSQLSHPNVVRVTDFGEEDGYAYIVMELIEGGTLRERLKDHAVSPREAWAALHPVCSALAYAHAKGIVHRDLKPENLMITAGGVLKVADFGLARAEDQQKLTQTGTVLGTPAYMAPEQIQGETSAPPMDQYARSSRP